MLQHNYNEKTFINKWQTACNTVATTALVVSWNPLEATDSSKLWTKKKTNTYSNTNKFKVQLKGPLHITACFCVKSHVILITILTPLNYTPPHTIVTRATNATVELSSPMLYHPSFPGLEHLSLAVQNSCRRPWLVHHVICAESYVTAILLRTNHIMY